MSKRAQEVKSKFEKLIQQFPPKRANISASSASAVYSPLDVQPGFKKVAESGLAKRSGRLDFVKLSEYVDPEVANKNSNVGDEAMDEDGDEDSGSKQNVEANRKPSDAVDDQMDQSGGGTKVEHGHHDEATSNKSFDAGEKKNDGGASGSESGSDGKVSDSKQNVEATGKSSDAVGEQMGEGGGGGKVGQEEDDDDEEEEDDFIDDLQTLKAGKPYIESPLLLKVIDVPTRLFERGKGGKAGQVANIVLEDAKELKVRLPLWNDHGLNYRPVFYVNKEQYILLSGVRLQAVTSDYNLRYLPEAEKYPYELTVAGTLTIKPIDRPPVALKTMEDLLKSPGVYIGDLKVKVGLAMSVIGYNGVDYNSTVVHDGRRKFRLFFSPDVDVKCVKKSSELVLLKLRVIRHSDDRMVFVESSRDYKLVSSKFRDIAQPKRVKMMPDLF